MSADRPAPGEEYNPGATTTPRQAATVILTRGGAEALEVLLVRRTPKARFMGGVWVFPGGALEAEEEGQREAHRAAAIRELHEEAGVRLQQDAELVEFSRWITPVEVKIRFDTRFFLATLPPGQEPAIDGQECIDLGWFAPQAALDAHAAGELALVFPTIKQLEELARFANAQELFEHARRSEVRPVLPQVLIDGETARVVLPGEPGYTHPGGEP